MSIISKLFKKKAVDSLFNELSNALNQNPKGENKPEQPQPSGGMTIGSTVPHYEAPVLEETIPGNSWGPTMPKEPNQFNYNGSWFDYFNEIFRAEFADFRIVSDRKEKTATFLFYRGEQLALAVEILHQASAAQKLRRDCRANGTPYLRYYHDHEGWWNTRAYVVERTRAALGN
ncbi:MAG: hypothetical protein IJM20_00035 [Clostridia bacterium]|jgi:hypothetical protein|nr:hypothetical protein [Clostridia bacterium]